MDRVQLLQGSEPRRADSLHSFFKKELVNLFEAGCSFFFFSFIFEKQSESDIRVQ